MQIPKGAQLPANPYFVPPEVLLRTSITHGTAKPSPDTVDVTFDIKVVEAISPDHPELQEYTKGTGRQVISAARIELGGEGHRLWFRNTYSMEHRLVVSRTGDGGWFLEVHSVMDKGDNLREKLWVLGQVLSRFQLANESPSGPAKGTDWQVEPMGSAVRVAAGGFSKGSYSTKTYEPSFNDPVPPHKIESWIADGVGLVKYVITGPSNNVLCTVELASYQLK